MNGIVVATATALVTTAVAVAGFVAAPHEAVAASASRSAISGKRAIGGSSDLVSQLKSSIGEDLVLLGRVDRVGPQGELFVLGQVVVFPGDQEVSVGDYVAVLGAPSSDGKVTGISTLSIGSMYVAGASQVYLKGESAAPMSSSGIADIGRQGVDLTPTMFSQAHLTQISVGSTLEIVGTQPVLGGVVIAETVIVSAVDGSRGTGRADGSLGTGRADGSLGTGHADGSLGTGHADGSLGTGRANDLES